MRMNEDFIRCPQCQGAYFQLSKKLILDKMSTKSDVIVQREETIYACVSCGTPLQLEE